MTYRLPLNYAYGMTDTRYYRTGKGQHRHASKDCAENKRSVFTGEVTEIPAGQVSTWPPCQLCCPAAEVAADAATQAEQSNRCPNDRGVTNPRRINSSCAVCGRMGKVLPSGKIRAHDRL